MPRSSLRWSLSCRFSRFEAGADRKEHPHYGENFHEAFHRVSFDVGLASPDDYRNIIKENEGVPLAQYPSQPKGPKCVRGV